MKKGLRISAKALDVSVAGATRLELATSGVTGYSSGFCMLNEIIYL
jgi:hypothetical protein